MYNEKSALDKYLEGYGIEEDLTNKEKLEILKKIKFNTKVEQDVLEMRYQKDKSKISSEEFLTTLNNLYIDQVNVEGYILQVRGLIRQEKHSKIKTFFQKTLNMKKN